MASSDDHTPSALATEDLVIPQGATESGTWPTPWLYAEGSTPGPPTGWPGSWTARMEIRDYRGDDSTVLALLHSSDTADGALTLDTVTEDSVTYARITPAIATAVSTAWEWGDGTPAVWDLEITDGTRVIRLVEGNVVLSGEVTIHA